MRQRAQQIASRRGLLTQEVGHGLGEREGPQRLDSVAQTAAVDGAGSGPRRRPAHQEVNRYRG